MASMLRRPASVFPETVAHQLATVTILVSKQLGVITDNHRNS